MFLKFLSQIYNFITALRNWLYDKGILKIYRSTLKTIGIGNLTVGGTGKTPHVEYLVRLLQNQYKIATLSRGYGRKTTGFLAANAQSTAQDLGDEPLQYFQKFSPNVAVFVSEKRAKGLKNIENDYKNVALVLLDDVFQHRAVSCDTLILITDYQRLFTNDHLLPHGLLREGRHNAQRADAVVVSKCPADLSKEEMERIKSEIGQYVSLANTPVFFSTIVYDEPKSYCACPDLQSGHEWPPICNRQSFWLVSAIAQPKLFENEIKKQYEVIGHSIFKDHHDFTSKDIEKILAQAQSCTILTTEKDWVKLAPLVSEKYLYQFYYIPIRVQFLDHNELSFDNWIFSKIHHIS